MQKTAWIPLRSGRFEIQEKLPRDRGKGLSPAPGQRVRTGGAGTAHSRSAAGAGQRTLAAASDVSAAAAEFSGLVFTATINSILAKVGESVLTNGQVGAIALNGAALGFVAFLFAKLLDVKLGNRKTVAIILLIAEIVIAIIGLLIMIRMFSVLYAA